jgi:hypothetical protein
MSVSFDRINRRNQMSNQNERKFGYSPKTAGGYTPPKSSEVPKNIPLPKGGSGSSGPPNAGSRQSGSGNGTREAGTKK